jgi:hypothetical protein
VDRRAGQGSRYGGVLPHKCCLCLNVGSHREEGGQGGGVLYFLGGG